MILLGAIVNAIAIIVGGIIGVFCGNIPEKIKQSILQVIALVVVMIGVEMVLNSNQIILALLSLLIGAMIGEYFDIEKRIMKLLTSVESKIKLIDGQRTMESFLMASVFYLGGAMAIVGAVDSGIRNDHTLFFTKSIMDGISAIFLTVTVGNGVILSGFLVLIVQGALTILAALFSNVISEGLLNLFISEFAGVGGILVIAVGLNLLEVVKIRVPNLLPSLVLILLFSAIYYI
ncbi:DUF554 family protein [Pseudogracilibacillus sp. SO30301A]|uniref:DUF554 family protein n=1 Tax=Pseudogracilibacillus sp. SO30301A TaxID=3098291 RepID=UPI00300DCA5A